MGIFEMASKNVCSTSIITESSDPFAATPGTSSAKKTPKHRIGCSDLELADEGDIQMEYLSF